MWKCLISRFLENVNTRERLSFSFPEIWDIPWKIQHQEIYQNLTNRARWNKRDIVWTCASSLSSPSSLISPNIPRAQSIGSLRTVRCVSICYREGLGSCSSGSKQRSRWSLKPEPVCDQGRGLLPYKHGGTGTGGGGLVNLGFWETADLPLSLPNILP